jgi:Holliday junction resolvasome RuvABC endonuclease subunit
MTKAFDTIKRGVDEALEVNPAFPIDGKVYVGIDPSLGSTGWCVIHNGRVKVGRFVSKKLRGCVRLQWFADEMEWLLGEFVPDVVCLEGYAFSARGRHHSSGELGGVIRMALHNARIETWVISPTNMKKFATDDGHAKKSLIIKTLFKRWDVDIDDEDEADAAALAIYAIAKAGNLPRITQSQTVAIKKAEALK